jgi:hypothetical protein
MPERTFILKEAKSVLDFKVFKNRRAVLLGGNVAGYKLKPFVIWHSKKPKAFKHINKHTLPVYYRSNKKDGPAPLPSCPPPPNCYASEMEKYCFENCICFKILLILDNAPGHPLLLVIFIPISK